MRRANGRTRNSEPRLLGVSEQLVYLALASLKKRGRAGIPSLREIETEIEILYGPQISQKTISRVLRRLEEKGHIRRRLVLRMKAVLSMNAAASRNAGAGMNAAGSRKRASGREGPLPLSSRPERGNKFVGRNSTRARSGGIPSMARFAMLPPPQPGKTGPVWGPRPQGVLFETDRRTDAELAQTTATMHG